MPDMIKRILTAPVYDVAIESPLTLAPGLSHHLGCKVWLKREDMQPIFSFKLRGAYAKMARLDEAARDKGVITASAGNHAQGVALAAKKLKIKALVVMPATTPEIKVKAVQAHGAEVILHGDAYDDAYLHARTLEKERGLTFIPPYDDPDVIAGQGTVAVEILRQHPGPIEAVFVPVGGGGLLAGVASYIKFVRPEVKVIAVEPEDSDCFYQAFHARRRVTLPQVGLFADGVAVRQIGEETFRLTRDSVDEALRVSTDDICAAIKDIFADTRSVAEPAGALAVAGVRAWLAAHPRDPSETRHRTFVALVSGANINFDRLRHVAERATIGERREILLSVTLPERPGSLRAFCDLLGKRAITEFNYRAFDPVAARIFVGVHVANAAHEGPALVRKLTDHGFSVQDLTDNELAKEHVRYMVGGHPPRALEEVLYRFEFPERPGALVQVLTALNPSWNISLFHYRNHGAAYGRVLMGLEIPPAERPAFRAIVDGLGFVAHDETDNPAYRLFLGG